MKSGTALPAVLLALAFSSALAVSGAYVTRQLSTTGRAALRGAELQSIVDAAIVENIAGWDSVAWTSQPIGTSTLTQSITSPGVRTQVWRTRPQQSLFWVVAESESALPPRLRRRVGVLVHVWSGAPVRVSSRAWAELP
jgi:monoamine oxidase